MRGGLIPKSERPNCPACNTMPRKLADREFRVWWCRNDSCNVHQFVGDDP